MSSLDIWYEDEDGRTLCFLHAVKAATEGRRISTEVQDNRDAGESGAWWIGGCKDCLLEM